MAGPEPIRPCVRSSFELKLQFQFIVIHFCAVERLPGGHCSRFFVAVVSLRSSEERTNSSLESRHTSNEKPNERGKKTIILNMNYDEKNEE